MAQPPAGPAQVSTNALSPTGVTKTAAVPLTPPPPPEDTLNRYGKILAPGNDPSHPLRLVMPWMDVGEVKIPSQDELAMRGILEQLATLSDSDIRAKLEQWPPYGKMSLKDEGSMLQRIQDFRDRHSKIALDKAHKLGLLTFTPAQQARFEKEYWEKRLKLDRDLAKQFQPIFNDREQKIQEELFREFSSPAPPPSVAQAPKPATPPVAPPSAPKPTPSTSASAAQTTVAR